jgi:hypothetical protein
LVIVYCWVDHCCTGVSWDGGYQTATSPPNYTTSYVTTSYYTEAHKNSDPSYYTEAHKYYTIKASEYFTTTYAATAYYTEAPKYYSAPAYYTGTPKYYSASSYIPTTEAVFITTQLFFHRSTVIRIITPRFAVYYTKIYAAPSYYTEAPVYYNTKAPEYYTITYRSSEVLLCPELLTTLRHLNIISQPMPLQHSTRRFNTLSEMFICKSNLILMRIMFFMRVIIL